MAERFGGAELLVLPDEQAIAREAAHRTVAALADAVARNGSAHIALTGGSAATPLYRELAAPELRDALDWRRVHLWWGDERFVPIDHPQSNAGLAYRTLLAMPALAAESGTGAQYADVAAGAVAGLAVDVQNVHPVEVVESLSDSDPAELAAENYRDHLARLVPLARGAIPRLDVILAGIGPDGHTLSLFPNSPGLAADAESVIAVPAPEHVEPRLARVTLTARVLPVAGLVIVMASGDGKAAVVSDVLGDQVDVERWPVQAALLPNSVWLLDRAAAARVAGLDQGPASR